MRHAHEAAIGQPAQAGVLARQTNAPSLHHGHAPRRRDLRLIRQEFLRPTTLSGRHSSGGLVRGATDGPSQHPAHIRVEDHVTLSERERSDCCCGVVADAGQLAQLGDRSRHLACKRCRANLRGRVQAQGAAGVAQPTPCPDSLPGRFRGEGCRNRPAPEPVLPDGQDAGDRRLLQHHLGDQHAPWGGVWSAPRQVPPVGGVPLEDRFEQRVRGHRVPDPPRQRAGVGTAILSPRALRRP